MSFPDDGSYAVSARDEDRRLRLLDVTDAVGLALSAMVSVEEALVRIADDRERRRKENERLDREEDASRALHREIMDRRFGLFRNE